MLYTLLPSSGIMGILTNMNGFTPVTPESRGTAEVVVVGPDPDGISAAGIHLHLETVGRDSQDLSGEGLVLLQINQGSAIQTANSNHVYLFIGFICFGGKSFVFVGAASPNTPIFQGKSLKKHLIFPLFLQTLSAAFSPW